MYYCFWTTKETACIDSAVDQLEACVNEAQPAEQMWSNFCIHLFGHELFSERFDLSIMLSQILDPIVYAMFFKELVKIYIPVEMQEIFSWHKSEPEFRSKGTEFQYRHSKTQNSQSINVISTATQSKSIAGTLPHTRRAHCDEWWSSYNRESTYDSNIAKWRQYLCPQVIFELI